MFTKTLNMNYTVKEAYTVS